MVSDILSMTDVIHICHDLFGCIPSCNLVT